MKGDCSFWETKGGRGVVGRDMVDGVVIVVGGRESLMIAEMTSENGIRDQHHQQLTITTILGIATLP